MPFLHPFIQFRSLLCLLMAFTLYLAPFSSFVYAQTRYTEWNFFIAPYLWGLKIDGDVTHQPYKFHAKASFRDIWSDLNWGVMGAFEAQKNRLGFLLDGFYVDLTQEVNLKSPPLPFPIDVNIDNKTYTLLAAVKYRLTDSPQGFIDILAGYRHWSLDTDFDISIPVANLKLSESAIWGDGQLGIRGNKKLGDRFYFEGMLLTGLRSDRTADLSAFAGYRINHCISLMAGYRYIQVDYSNSDYQFDAKLHGLALGFSYQF